MPHTKGSWSTYGNAITAKARTIDIAYVNENAEIPASEKRDNKKLIKAAPDMYEALQAILESMEAPLLSGTKHMLHPYLREIERLAKKGLRKAPKKK